MDLHRMFSILLGRRAWRGGQPGSISHARALADAEILRLSLGTDLNWPPRTQAPAPRYRQTPRPIHHDT